MKRNPPFTGASHGRHWLQIASRWFHREIQGGASMSLRVLCRGLLAVAVLVVTAGAAFAQAPTAWAPFYAEVPKDGRIYVFSIGAPLRHLPEERRRRDRRGHHAASDTAPTARRWCSTTRTRSTSTTSSTSLPGEYFAPPKVDPAVALPGRKVQRAHVRGLLRVRQVAPEHDQRRQHQQRAGAAGLLVPPHLLHVRPDVQREVHDPRPARGEQQRPVHEPREHQPVHQGRVPEVDVLEQAGLDARHPAQLAPSTGTRASTACATSRRRRPTSTASTPRAISA